LSRPLVVLAWRGGRNQTGVDRYSEVPVAEACVALAAKHERGDRAKSWSRRSLAGPGRANPKGAFSGWRPKHTFGREGLRQGSNPRNCGPLDRPGASAAGKKAGETVCGGFGAVTLGYLAGGESSEGRIPGALPVRNKAGAGSKGGTRREGNQTLGADRSGQATLADSGPSILHVL
jgi:hypothetical protein